MSEEQQREFARKIALKLLDARPRSEAEFRAALQRKGVPERIIAQLIRRYTEVGLLNDKAYAAALTSTRSRVSLRGRSRIRVELQQKGLSPEVVSEAIEEISDTAEIETARQFAARKFRSLSGLESVVARRRLYGALARRGYSPGVVRRVTEEVLGELEGLADLSPD